MVKIVWILLIITVIAEGSRSFDSRIVRSSNSGNNIYNFDSSRNVTTLANNNGNSDKVASLMRKRVGRIVTLRRILPLTAPRAYLHATVHLALEHFNQRNGAVLPFLPDRLKDCDFYFSSWEFIDGPVADTMGSARKFLEENQKVCRHSNQEDGEDGKDHEDILAETCPPFAVLGGLSMLGDAYRVPHLSAAYTSHSYSSEESLSALITPTHTGGGQAIAIYLDFLEVSHVAILYSKTKLGFNFHSDTVIALQQRNITVLSLPVVQGKAEKAIGELAASKYKYVVFLYHFPDNLELFELAYSYKVMGYPGYTWLFSGGTSPKLVSPTFTTTNADLAKALHGSAYFTVKTPARPSFRQTMLQFAKNTTSQQEFIQHFQQPEIFSAYNFTSPFIPLAGYYQYDTVLALGIAACETPGLFTGEQLFESLLRIEFEGLTGIVSFDSETHARSVPSLNYVVQNIAISEEKSTSSHFYFTSQLTSAINITNNSAIEMQSFIYADNTTQRPLSLPPLVQDQNLIPDVARIVGLSLDGLALSASLGWMIWTYIQRNEPLVRASQPFFLCQLCVGTFIMSLSVIPSSFQEPMQKHQLDIACMSVPWLVLIGFATSFSALFAKAWRLNKLFRSGVACRRSKIQPRHVIWPFLTLVVVNFVLLMAWTVIDPLEWDRLEVSNYDSFGRSQESYGRCFLSGLPFFMPLLVVNFIPILIALYQSWKVRNLSDEFSESSYVGFSVFSIGETIILFIPVMFAAKDNPTAYFVLYSLLISILCFAILLPIFVPKFLKNGKWDRRAAQLSISRLTVDK